MLVLTFQKQCLVTFLSAEGDLRSLKFIHEHGANLNNRCKGAFPIIVAVQSRRHEIVHYLISERVNVNVRDKDLMTPLMWAAEKGSADISKELIDSGADIGAVDRIGSTALWYAVRSGGYTTAESLIQAGGNVNQAGPDGITPLMLAATSGNVGLVKLLLRSGAKPQAQDDKGRTALDHVDRPNIDLVKLLTPQSPKN
jgi:ankyrin repeat protein